VGKYLLRVNYTSTGLRGLTQEGAANRAAYISEFAERLGGTVESFHFALGDYDAYVLLDAPDDRAVTAASLAVGGSGVASINTVKLLTPAEVDEAIGTIADYRPPGE
jgi:uncharacterized protein with GYD domain